MAKKQARDEQKALREAELAEQKQQKKDKAVAEGNSAADMAASIRAGTAFKSLRESHQQQEQGKGKEREKRGERKEKKERSESGSKTRREKQHEK